MAPKYIVTGLKKKYLFACTSEDAQEAENGIEPPPQAAGPGMFQVYAAQYDSEIEEYSGASVDSMEEDDE